MTRGILRKILIILSVVGILTLSVGYPLNQLVKELTTSPEIIFIEEKEEGDHQHENGDHHDEDENHHHDNESNQNHHYEENHAKEEKNHHHENGEEEHMEPAFEKYGLIKSEPGYKEYNVKLSQFSFEPDTIRVKKGDRVRLNMDSVDVMHGLSIDGYNINVQIPVEKTVHIEFIASKPGTLKMRCSVTCGAFHPFMIGKVVVEPDTKFPWAMILVGLGPLIVLGIFSLTRKKLGDGNDHE